MNLRREVGYPPLNGLLVGQLRAEQHPLVRLLDHHLQRASGDADGPCGHLQPPAREAGLHRGEALAHLAQQVGSGDLAILKDQLVCHLPPEHPDLARHCEAGRPRIDEESGDATVAAIPGVRLGHQDDMVHRVAPRDPDLRAIDDPIVALLDRLALHPPWVGASAGFGDADGGNGLPTRVWQHVALALLFVARFLHHVEVRRVRREGEGHDRPAELLVDDDQGCVRQVNASKLLRKIQAPQAELFALVLEAALLLKR
mmetsp:Transcript_29439/g.83885  ORF Transcript_29439/g.83885 Transcript_29439/m.83885 type:complete len:257 (+) Transcript_29439:490-1260(+)